MTIYIDVIFIENILMNFIILLATGKILKKKVSYVRLFIASALGSLYVVVSYLTKFKLLYEIGMKVLLSIAITYIAYDSKNIKIQIKEILTFYLVSFVFGGTAFAAIYFLKPENIIMRNGVYTGRYAINTLILSCIIAFILVNIVFRINKRRISKSDTSCKMKIEYKGKSIIANTMIDTGNCLKDPITGKTVAIVEKEIIKSIIPQEILNSMDDILNGKYIENSLEKYETTIKLIPFSSIGKEHRINISHKS